MRQINLMFKRCFDILASLMGLLLLFPLFIVLSIMIKLDSNGPVFFKQERLGKYGKVFRIIKFRTMVVNAENQGDKLSVKDENDIRITKLGRLLRKTSLDELPQLLNILIGNMSIVGPRPPVTYFPYQGYDNYPDWAKQRFQMTPGLTGLAQVKVRNSVTWDERIKLDIEYIDSFSFMFDIKIIVLTLFVLFANRNIYKSSGRK